MKILSLSVRNFRNLKTQTIEFFDGLNVLFGKNAQGKTNTMEAIYLSTIGKSPKTRRDGEMICFSHGHLETVLKFEHNQIVREIKVDIKHNQKNIFLDGEKLKRLSDVIGNFGSVYFSPEELELVRLGPSLRRRFLDVILCQQDKSYLKDLQSFQKILKNRNALLKQQKSGLELLVWDKQLVLASQKIFEKRKQFVKDLNLVAKEIHFSLTNGQEELEIFYQSSLEEKSAEEILEILKQNIEKDTLLGYTSFGIQNDDLSFKINKKDAKKHASQGQTRTIVLSLKLAELKILEKEYGGKPVLLLDDVLSELDFERRQKLCDYLKDIQCILTCTEFDLNLSHHKFFVEDGNVRSQN